jgi:hypothetical protein
MIFLIIKGNNTMLNKINKAVTLDNAPSKTGNPSGKGRNNNPSK